MRQRESGPVRRATAELRSTKQPRAAVPTGVCSSNKGSRHEVTRRADSHARMLGLVVQLPDVPILEESCMRKSWLLCVLMGTLAWGQAQPGMTSAPAPSAATKAPEPAAEVPESAVVLTIKGVCPAPAA